MNRANTLGLSLAVTLTVATAGCDRSTGAAITHDAGPQVDAADGGGPPDAEDGSVSPDAGDGAVSPDAGDASTGCVPGESGCLGDDLAICNSDGIWEVSAPCPALETCVEAVCVSRCDPLALGTSNLGCTFWAVDLDNEYVDTTSAAAAPFAVVVANPQSAAVTVEVYQNTASVGEVVSEQLVTTSTVAAGAQAQLNLPQREVDGTMGQNGTFTGNSGSGTFVSPHGYRIVSDGPVAAFQFNPVVDAYSNDAALLLPDQVLGTSYTVIGWPTANPCGTTAMPMDSIPDHTSVTIVGVHPATQVTVTVTHPVAASSGDSGIVVPETPAGGQIVVTLGPYDVLNLESLQPVVASPADCSALVGQDGDFTGTVITATAPVVVFSSGERGTALGGATPPDPPNWDNETCCTDHLEEQLAPDSALGWQFAVGRSPVRSDLVGYQEPDVYRIVATANNTVVTTTLPSPFDQLTLQAGEVALFWAYDGFTAESQGGAVAVGQYLVSAGYVPQPSLGDPSWVALPPVAQMLTSQVVAIPPTYADTYLVITYPVGASLSLDGAPIGPTTTGCDLAAIGALGATSFEQLTCLVTPQVHAVSADQPVGVTVFGYSNVSSFAYSGGSGVAPINP